MARFPVSKRDETIKVTVKLNGAELEWTTIAVENELAIRGKELASGQLLSFNADAISYLASTRDRLVAIRERLDAEDQGTQLEPPRDFGVE